MDKTFRLIRTKQCAKCPWKVSTNPFLIPNGYCSVKHEGLKSTIAVDTDFSSSKLKVMACHHSNGKDQMYCVGWLHNQLGVGNNILLRLKMMNCENISKIETFGEQHGTFEATLPKTK